MRATCTIIHFIHLAHEMNSAIAIIVNYQIVASLVAEWFGRDTPQGCDRIQAL